VQSRIIMIKHLLLRGVAKVQRISGLNSVLHVCQCVKHLWMRSAPAEWTPSSWTIPGRATALQ